MTPNPILEAISDMRVEMATRFTGLESEVKGINARLVNHSDRIEKHEGNIRDLDKSRHLATGALVTLSGGTGFSLAYLFTELGKLLKSIKGGG